MSRNMFVYIGLVLVLFSQILVAQPSISTESKIKNDSIFLYISIQNTDQDTLLIPISNWNIAVPEYPKFAPFASHDLYGGYNMIHIYKSKKGKWDYEPLAPYCLLSEFPSFVIIDPGDTLQFILKTKVNKLKKKEINKYLYALIKVNYVLLNQFRNERMINSYLLANPHLITNEHCITINYQDMTYKERNMVNYRIENKNNQIDSDFGHLICKYMKNYVKTNIRIK